MHMDHTWEDTVSGPTITSLRGLHEGHSGDRPGLMEHKSQEWPRLRPKSPSESHPSPRGRLQLFYLPPGSPHPWKVSSPDSLVLGGFSKHLPTSTFPTSGWWVLCMAPHPQPRKDLQALAGGPALRHEGPLSPWPRDRSTTHQRPRRGSEAPEGVPHAWSHR